MTLILSILFLLALCGGLDVCEEMVEGGAVEEAAMGDYGSDFAGVADVVEWVGAQQHQVSDFSCFYRSHGGFAAQELRGVAGGRL